ncbi:hypothetical protein [Hyalangium sp.]|uniref:hypothetical protein n=1 Tax=Hyalangium sp. TaxID=2028555 RepID=UPI002D3DEC12|nr:hypothetical protein [Hyalangium sp.]HYI01901.1 hypothetical protein [Hyalangium sp.]
MLLNAATIDEVRAYLVQGRAAAIEGVRPSGITLDAALELACAATQWEASSNAIGTALFKKWSGTSSVLPEAASLLSGEVQAPSTPEMFAAPQFELFLLRRRADILETPWDLYRQRFGRSLKSQGFSSTLAHALSKALDEMADNVIQHSGSDESKPATGLIGYHVNERWMQFAVVDLGRGLLNSLRTNPKWSTLSDSKSALQEAIQNYATRRKSEKEGGGFKQVHKALADLNGHLRFRSGDAVLTLDGRGKERAARIMSSPVLPGFQLSVTCSLDQAGPDLPLPT